MTDERIGTILDGRYRVEGEIATGGMGVVYRGERLGLGRTVAIKFLHAHVATDPSFSKRFEIEARAMARLQHPNCASIIDFGVAGGAPYVVMDLVAGESLSELLERGPLPPPRALGIMRQVLAGLAHAHAQGITHRDIKPDNIMVDSSDAFGDQVRILDFGIAKLREGSAELTGAVLIGTPNYMAPEQSLLQPVNERSDIYAAGVVLYEMLTGEKPFQADEAIEVMRLHREDPVPSPAEHHPGLALSDALEEALLRALAKDPADRFASAAAFATALEGAPESGRASTVPPALEPAVVPATAAAPAGKATPREDLGSAPTAPMAAVANPLENADTDRTDPEEATPRHLLGNAATEPATLPDGTPVDAVEEDADAGEPTASHAGEPHEPHAGESREPHAGEPRQPTARSGDRALPPPPRDAAHRPDDAGDPPPSERVPPESAPPDEPMDAPGSRLPRRLSLAILVALVALGLVVVLARGNEDERDPAPPTDPAPRDPDRRPSVVPIDAPPLPTPSEVLTGPRALLEAGRVEEARDRLIDLLPRHRELAELHYLLGRAYFGSLWCKDGLSSFRTAIELAPAYRTDPKLIESAVYGLANDTFHTEVSRFLLTEIGPAARPALEDMAEDYQRKDVRERAQEVLRRLGSAQRGTP